MLVLLVMCVHVCACRYSGVDEDGVSDVAIVGVVNIGVISVKGAVTVGVVLCDG